MNIYQLHKCSGEWEDYRDYIAGTYLREERAEEEKAKAEAKENELVEHSKRCCNCPFLDTFDTSPSDINDLLSKHPDYCSKAKLFNDEEYGIDCENFYQHWDRSHYYINEVEVEE